MLQWRPRTLAGQAVALQLAVVVVIVVAAAALALLDARLDGVRAAREQVTSVAVSIADAPSTARALASPDPTASLQPVTEEIRSVTGLSFITIMNTEGVRYTHTRPALIGQRYLGSTSQALRGEVYTETYTGTLGPSIRSIAPVRNDEGVIVGMVAVGITQATLTDEWLDQLPLIASIGLVAIVAALGGLWLIRRRLLRLTGGLAPGELRVMYDHHDAVLHSVKEGLVVIDDGTIALCNDEARRLLAGDRGGDVAELDEMPEFLLGTEPLTDVLYVDQGRVLVVNRAPVSTRPGSTVVTIRDRTELSAAIGELDSLSRFAEALRSQAHESANRLHTMVALIETGHSERAADLATADLALSQRLVDRVSDTISDPTLSALLLGKSAQAAERGISMTLTEESALDSVETSPLTTDEMITIVGNLIDNALDACDPDDPWVEVTVASADGFLRIVVADSGPGMTDAEFERACSRGYSTKSGGDAQGRGLGLALVSHVVNRHGGTLRSEHTYGSVVTVEIPSGE